MEKAGRLFEGWVRRRQQLADVLPELSVKMEYCHNRSKDFAKSEAESALQSLQQRLEEDSTLLLYYMHKCTEIDIYIYV